MNRREVYLKDICKIVTYKKYQEDKQVNRICPDNDVLFVNKVICPKLPTCQKVAEKPTYVVISDKMTLDYISFFLNSSLGKLLLICGDDKRKQIGLTNLSKLKHTKIVIDDTITSSCLKLEEIINFILQFINNQHREELKRYSKALSSFFTHLRDYIVMELLFPEMLEKVNISICQPWLNEVSKLSEAQNIEDTVLQLFESLLQPNNELMSNANKVRVFLTEFTDHLIEESKKNGVENK